MTNKKCIIDYLKKSKFLLYFVAFIYSVYYGSNVWRYLFNKNVCIRGAFLRHTKIIVNGTTSHVYIGPKCQLNHCVITCYGGSVVIYGPQTCINNSHFVSRGKGSVISTEKDFSMMGGTIQSAGGKKVSIGSHCMFSGDIEILSSDLHPIYSTEDGSRINFERDIEISDHVWLGAHVRVLKGCCINSNIIIGNSSLVNGQLEESHCIYAGIPEKK